MQKTFQGLKENLSTLYCAVVKPQTQAPGLGPRLLLVKHVYPHPLVPFYLN